MNDPIIDLIMDYRELSKLQNTYTNVLPRLIDSEERVHTTFNQAVTATGRLSSSEPNLQNIPIKTELGREFRKVFIARPDCLLIKAKQNVAACHVGYRSCFYRKYDFVSQLVSIVGEKLFEEEKVYSKK